jgi:hypothetical protein
MTTDQFDEFVASSDGVALMQAFTRIKKQVTAARDRRAHF